MDASLRRAGYSLAEVILATGTIAVCILTIVGLILALSGSSRKSVDGSAAQMAANQIMTKLIYQAQANEHSAFWDTPNWNPYKTGVWSMNRTEFAYSLDAQAVTNTTGQNVGTATGMAQNRLKVVNLHLTWHGSDSANRAGYGRHSTDVGRIVREEAP